MKVKINNNSPRPEFHTCSVCNSWSTWNDNWSWCFEIVKVHGFPIEETRKFCSEKCQKEFKAKKITPKPE